MAETGNAHACEHHIQGRVFKQTTSVEAAYDPASHKVVVRSETDEDGQAFPG